MDASQNHSRILGTVCFALSHPMRIRILELLVVRPRSAGEIREMLGLKRSLLSQHASKLVHAGLAMSVRYGRTVEYSIDDRAVGVIREYIRLVEAMAGEG